MNSTIFDNFETQISPKCLICLDEAFYLCVDCQERLRQYDSSFTVIVIGENEDNTFYSHTTDSDDIPIVMKFKTIKHFLNFLTATNNIESGLSYGFNILMYLKHKLSIEEIKDIQFIHNTLSRVLLFGNYPYEEVFITEFNIQVLINYFTGRCDKCTSLDPLGVTSCKECICNDNSLIIWMTREKIMINETHKDLLQSMTIH